MFTCSMSDQVVKARSMFSYTFSEDFASHFDDVYKLVTLKCPSNNLDAEQQLILFNSTWTEILDPVVPFWSKQLKPKVESKGHVSYQ